MKSRDAWIGAGAVVLAGLIGGSVELLKPSEAKSAVVQNNKDGNNTVVAGGSNEEKNLRAGRDIVETTVYGDTSKKPTGDTYNVTSNGQKGGITSAKAYVYIFKNVTVLAPGIKQSSGNVRANFICSLDSVNKQIMVQPKTGSWDSTFIGIPFRETEIANLHFTDEKLDNIKIRTGVYYLQSDSLFGMLTTSHPATQANYFVIHFQHAPSYIVFGNYSSGPLYKAEFASRQAQK